MTCSSHWGASLSRFRVMSRCGRKVLRRCNPVRSAYYRANPIRELTRNGVLALSVELRLSRMLLFCLMTPLIQMLVVFQSPLMTLMHWVLRFPVMPCSFARVSNSPGEYSTGFDVSVDGRMTLELAKTIISCGVSDDSHAPPFLT